MVNMQNLADISDAAIKKAMEVIAAGPTGVQKDINSASGCAAYDLQPVSILLQPVITPWRNSIPRVQNKRGGTSSEWRSISAVINAGLFNPFLATEGAKANRITYTATPFTARFAEIGVSDIVTWAAIDSAMGFEGDLKARAVTNALFATMIAEEQVIGFGRVLTLPTPTNPTASYATSGGSVADGTYYVYVRAITGLGDGTIPRGCPSASYGSTGAISGGTGTANIITAYTPWVEGAVAYEWFVDDGSTHAAGTIHLEATTTINSVSLSTLAATGRLLSASTNNSANAMGLNGLIPSFTATLGASVKTLATGTSGVGTDVTLDDIDAMNQSVWDTARGNPETIWVNSAQMSRLTNLVLAANGAPTLFVQAGTDEMAQLTGGYMLAKYVNKTTGRLMAVRVHPAMPNGMMLAFSQTIPFPTGGDQVGIDIEFSRDYQQVDYALTAKQYEFEVYCREALRPKFPGGAWVIRNMSGKTTA